LGRRKYDKIKVVTTYEPISRNWGPLQFSALASKGKGASEGCQALTHETAGRTALATWEHREVGQLASGGIGIEQPQLDPN
jgi:hypothetical protein